MTLSPAAAAPRRLHLPLERTLFALAGTMTILGSILGIVVSPWFLALTIFVGLNQWVFALAGDCPASLVLRRTVCRAGSSR
ncbi:MAG: DUF2892 domain-containing protein [Thermoleophilia bacterium]